MIVVDCPIEIASRTRLMDYWSVNCVEQALSVRYLVEMLIVVEIAIVSVGS